MREVIDVARTRGLRELWLEVLTPTHRRSRSTGSSASRRCGTSWSGRWRAASLNLRRPSARSRSSRLRLGSHASGGSGNRGSGRTSRSRTTRTSKRSKASEERSSSSAAVNESPSCRRSPATRRARRADRGPPRRRERAALAERARGDPFNAAIASLGGASAWTDTKRLTLSS